MTSSITPSSIPTLSSLYRDGTIRPSRDKSMKSPSAAHNACISTIRTDITCLAVDAIVNAANKSLLGGGGVDGAIHRNAGRGLLDECRTLHGCDIGAAKVTGAYDLPCKYVIHTVGPIRGRFHDDTREKALLKSCYVECIKLANDKKCKSLAFSCVGTGVYGWGAREAAEVVLGTLRDYLDREEDMGEAGFEKGTLERIVICCFEQKDVKAYEGLLPIFFPPTDEDLGKIGSQEAQAAEEDSGDAQEEDWEEVEKPGESAENGGGKTASQKAGSTADLATKTSLLDTEPLMPGGSGVTGSAENKLAKDW
ncbi:hypothetical protein MMC25_002953 [Agyrium rufum]|nr:hypothetical protein [Agyrium rufum]